MKNFYNKINKEEIGSFWSEKFKQTCPENVLKLVKNVKIVGQKINAEIKGDFSNSFKIEIAVKSVNNEVKSKITDELEKNPSSAFYLSLGYIDDTLAGIAATQEIGLFPYSNKDFDVRCSCGENGFCGHAAAVISSLEKKINKNPSLVFSLRGLSILELVYDAGYENSNLKKLKNPFGERFLQIKGYKKLADFSLQKTDIELMFSLLPNNPLFFERKDFKNKLKSIYQTIEEELENILVSEKLTPLRNTEFYFYYSQDNKLKAFFTPVNTFLSHLKLKGSRLKFSQKVTDIPDVGEKDGASIEADMALDYFLYDAVKGNSDEISESAQFVRANAVLALDIVKSLNFIPQVVKKNEQEFCIRYIPNNTVKEDYPELLPIFITHIVHKIGFLRGSKFGNDGITNLFLRPVSYNSITPEGNNLALSLALWLEAVSADKDARSAVLRVENLEDNNFGLYLDIENYKNLDLVGKIVSASEFMPILKDMLDSKGAFVPVINLKDVLNLISNISAHLMALGVQIVIPKELNNIISPRILMRAKKKNNKNFDIASIFNNQEDSKLSVKNLFDFSYEIALGDEKISREEFLALVKSADEIVKFKNNYVLLNPLEIQAILEKLNNSEIGFTNSMSFLQSTFSGFYDGMDFEIEENFRKALDDFLKVDEISIPNTLNGVLRPYQERGLKWLYANTIRGFGSCMADDMGLGKTIQVISLLLKFQEENNLCKPALVVCPTTLVGNWQKECAKFAPSLKVFIYHGADRVLNLEGVDVLITTYGMLRRDLDDFKKEEWDFVIIDEAQNIKNPDAAQTLAVKSLKAKTAIAMTGTPVENRLTELWSIFDYINKGYLGNLRGFQRNYANIIEKNRDEERIQKLKLATAPFTLRRMKSDKSIISDLPEKIIFDEYCYLTKEQAALYEKVLEHSFKEMEGKSGIHRRGHIFKLITSLKQICNHPAHYTKGGKIFPSLSGKADKILSIIGQILEQNEKTIIFTQYKEMGDLLVKMIKDELDETAPFFHGSLSIPEREKLVEDFQANENTKLMVVSLKAGGTGLNLTAATNVIHYDLWWNPAVEDQATDRTYRIGQTKNVIVYRLITLGTFEEKIDEMIKSKKQLADLTVSTGENWITELSDIDLRDIFSLSQKI